MNKLLGLSGALLLMGCGAAPENPANSLANTEWVLTAFEAASGVADKPSQYFTLRFNGSTQLQGDSACGHYQGQYQQTDALINISALTNQITANCALNLPDADYFTYLNASKTLTVSDSTLALQLPDGRHLKFVKKFPGCNNPLPVAGTPGNTVEIIPAHQPVTDLISSFEQKYPDFVITSAANCANSVVASVNPDTLAQLRCNTAVASLVYK